MHRFVSKALFAVNTSVMHIRNAYLRQWWVDSNGRARTAKMPEGRVNLEDVIRQLLDFDSFDVCYSAVHIDPGVRY